MHYTFEAVSMTMKNLPCHTAMFTLVLIESWSGGSGGDIIEPCMVVVSLSAWHEDSTDVSVLSCELHRIYTSRKLLKQFLARVLQMVLLWQACSWNKWWRGAFSEALVASIIIKS